MHHHPNNGGGYEYCTSRRTPSPIGVLNNMARHHPHERIPSPSVGMLPATVDVAGGIARDTGRRQQLPGDTAPPGYAAGWDKAAVDRRSHFQVSVPVVVICHTSAAIIKHGSSAVGVQWATR